MAHHPRYRRRIVTGRPGAHPVYARLAEKKFEREHQRVDAIWITGKVLVSQALYESLKSMNWSMKEPEVIIGTDRHRAAEVFIKNNSPESLMRKMFEGVPLQVSPLLPMWRKLSKGPPEGETHLSLATPPEEMFGKRSRPSAHDHYFRVYGHLDA